MTKPTVTDEMVNRFLSWRLPSSFNPDCGISFKRTYNESSPYGPAEHEPTGTNLLDAVQARAMLEHVLAGCTQAPAATEAPSDWWRTRADEIELQVALSGSTEAMRCFTDMRTLLQSALAAVGASVQPAAGALPPVRWWSGVVGSPEKLANLLDGYSEKKESPRRDERVMRAAAKWIREVVASVQPVLASLSDEPVRLALDALEEIALAGMSGTGQESEEGMQAWHARRAWEFIGIAARARDEVRTALASSTPTQPPGAATPKES